MRTQWIAAALLCLGCHKRPVPDAAQAVPEALPALEAVLAAQSDAVNDCFGAKALQGVVPEGILQLRWTVTGKGGVQDIEVQADSMHSATVRACVEKLLRGLRYPPHGTQEPVGLNSAFKAP